MAPRKVRHVAMSIKGLAVHDAEAHLMVAAQRSREPLLKLLRSAIANAKNNAHLDPNRLIVKEVRVDEGPMLKRFMPRAMGRATPIHKKTSHVSFLLQEVETPSRSRFTIMKREKVSPRQAETQKEKTEQERKHRGRVREERASREGFMKRMFRRKSV